MELQQINNQTVNSLINAGVSSTQGTNFTEEVAELNTPAMQVAVDAVDVVKRSDLTGSVGKFVNNISATSSITSMLQNQVKSIDNIQDKISNITNDTAAKDSIQPDVAQFISKFNSSTGTVNEMIDRLSDLEGNSTTYFDGSAGAIPLDIDMLSNSMATKRSELSSTLDKVQEVNEMFKELAQNVISTEVQKTQEASPFKEINFGKESADFTTSNISNIAGSVASSQANAMQVQSIKLLS